MWIVNQPRVSVYRVKSYRCLVFKVQLADTELAFKTQAVLVGFNWFQFYLHWQESWPLVECEDNIDSQDQFIKKTSLGRLSFVSVL